MGELDLTDMAQDRYRWRALVNSVMNLQVWYSAGKLSSGYTASDLSSSSQLHRVGYCDVTNLNTAVCMGTAK
jgi:hypothetical protein